MSSQHDKLERLQIEALEREAKRAEDIRNEAREYNARLYQAWGHNSDGSEKEKRDERDDTRSDRD